MHREQVQVRVRSFSTKAPKESEWRWRKLTKEGQGGLLKVFLTKCLDDTDQKQTSVWPESQELAASQIVAELSDHVIVN